MESINLTRKEGYELMNIPYEEEGTDAYYDDFRLINGYILEYTYVPSIEYRNSEIEWFSEQLDLETGESRHCGMTSGSFYTEWDGALV